MARQLEQFRSVTEYQLLNRNIYSISRVQWLRGRASDSRLRPGLESCAAVLKPWARFFNLHCSSSLSCIKEYGPSRINYSIRLDASQRC